MIIFTHPFVHSKIKTGESNRFTYVPMGPMHLFATLNVHLLWVQVPLRYRAWMYCSGVHLNPNNMFHTIEWQSEATVDVQSSPFFRMRFESKAVNILILLFQHTDLRYFITDSEQLKNVEDKTFTWMNFPLMVNLSIIHMVGRNAKYSNYNSSKRYC